MGVAAFRSGVGVSARDGLPSADLIAQTYYALGLFVLGGLDLGVPQGGPIAARGMLWLVYFLAPIITTSAAVEGLLRLLRPSWLERRGLRNHVVVVGIGRLGLLFVEILREREPRLRVLVVDEDGQRANARVVQDRFGARFLAGDIRAKATLDSLQLERARAVVLLTDDDLVNLEAAWAIAARAPRASVLAHVGDMGMRRTVERVEGRGEERVRVFNSHRVAAEHLYKAHLEAHFAQTEPEDVVVLAGFGRFGQTIFEYLRREAGGEIQRAVIVDSVAARQARLFRAQVLRGESCEFVTIEGDVDEPETWQRVEDAVHGTDVPPAYVIATDDDRINLRAAVALRSLDAEAQIFVRVVYESRFTERLAEELRFTVLPVEAMLGRAVRERLTEWLG